MSFELEQLREAAEKYTFHEGRLFGSGPCSWSFRRKKVQPSMCSSLVFFASEFFEYPSCRSVSFVLSFGIGWKSNVTLVTSMVSWSLFYVKSRIFPLSIL